MIGKGPLASTALPGWGVCALTGVGDEPAPGMPLRVGPVVRSESGRGVAGQSDFVVLRTLERASVYLGALIDQADRVHEWLEIWVEEAPADDGDGGGGRDLWGDQMAAMAAISQGELIAGDWPSSSAELSALGREGKLKANQLQVGVAPEVLARSRAISLIDGKNGLGQVAAAKAMALAMESARESGISITFVRNTNNVGFLSHYAMINLFHSLCRS